MNRRTEDYFVKMYGWIGVDVLRHYTLPSAWLAMEEGRHFGYSVLNSSPEWIQRYGYIQPQTEVTDCVLDEPKIKEKLTLIWNSLNTKQKANKPNLNPSNYDVKCLGHKGYLVYQEGLATRRKRR